MITGQEQPDEGQVAVDRGVTIGYFSQDVGEMAGPQRGRRGDGRRRRRSATVAAELAELEAAMADPDRADELDEHHRALRRGAGAASRSWAATRWKAGRGRSWPAWASARR